MSGKVQENESSHALNKFIWWYVLYSRKNPWKQKVWEHLGNICTKLTLVFWWLVLGRCCWIAILLNWLLCDGPDREENDVCSSAAAEWSCLHAHHCSASGTSISTTENSTIEIMLWYLFVYNWINHLWMNMSLLCFPFNKWHTAFSNRDHCKKVYSVLRTLD